jgi:hypothetical protein
MKTKFVAEGVELVRDVIEADNEEQAEKLFRVRYPAVVDVTSRPLKGWPKND